MFDKFNTFDKCKKIWNSHGFLILFILSIVVILLMSLFRLNKKGTWSNSYMYDKGGGQQRRNGPPKESKGEIECRRVLKKLFNRPFNKCRPDFLRNPVTGGNFNLELDCYDDQLHLAVEYNGIQHYKYVPYFHKNKEAFLNQKYRDDMKRRICKDNKITLIEVPNTVDVTDIENYLISKLKIAGYRMN
jgi:hypothetical protein